MRVTSRYRGCCREIDSVLNVNVMQCCRSIRPISNEQNGGGTRPNDPIPVMQFNARPAEWTSNTLKRISLIISMLNKLIIYKILRQCNAISNRLVSIGAL